MGTPKGLDVTPDFKFRIQYNRLGYNNLHVEDLAPLRNFKHNDYERFVSGAGDFWFVLMQNEDQEAQLSAPTKWCEAGTVPSGRSRCVRGVFRFDWTNVVKRHWSAVVLSVAEYRPLEQYYRIRARATAKLFSQAALSSSSSGARARTTRAAC